MSSVLTEDIALPSNTTDSIVVVPVAVIVNAALLLVILCAFALSRVIVPAILRFDDMSSVLTEDIALPSNTTDSIVVVPVAVIVNASLSLVILCAPVASRVIVPAILRFDDMSSVVTVLIAPPLNVTSSTVMDPDASKFFPSKITDSIVVVPSAEIVNASLLLLILCA